MDIDYNKLWNEIDEVVQKEMNPKLPHERTVQELGEMWGMTNSKSIRDKADKLVEQGILSVRMVKAKNGKYAPLYAPSPNVKK